MIVKAYNYISEHYSTILVAGVAFLYLQQLAFLHPHSSSSASYRKMSAFLVAAVLLCLVNYGVDLATAWEDKDFFKYCQPSKCSKHGPEIRFPFRLESNNTSSSCSTPCMALACSGQDTILVHPVLGPCKVTTIDYRYPGIKIIPLVDSLSPCPLQKLISRSIPYEQHQGHCDVYYQYYATLVCCSKEFTRSIHDADSVAGPVSCLSNVTHFSYLVDSFASISILPSDCKVCLDGVIPLPINYDIVPFSFKRSAEGILSFSEMAMEWENSMYEIGNSSKAGINCPECERQGKHCAFSSQRNQTFCMRHGIV